VKLLRLLVLALLAFAVSAGTPKPAETTHLKIIVGVTDDEILLAMRLLFERLKVVVEPSGASALAAILAGRVEMTGRRVGVTLSGGNIDADQFSAAIGQIDDLFLTLAAQPQ